MDRTEKPANMPGDTVAEPVVGSQPSAATKDSQEQTALDLHHDPLNPKEAEQLNLDHLHEELEDFPSQEEIETLRRVSAHIPLKLFTIAFVELCERFSYYGSTVVFTNFIQIALPDGSTTGAPLDPSGANARAGALGMGQQASTGITTFNQFWQYFMPLFGAYVADQYWGRYKTICVALGIDLIGHVILIMSAIPPVITRPYQNSLGAMIVAILVIGFGTGGFKPNISPLIAEQLEIKHMKVKTLKSGERVIVDPAVTINRVYNWFYFFINVGALIGQLTMAYAERYVGFWLSFLLPTCMLALCPLVMWWGRNRYQDRPPAGSVLGPALKTLFLAQKGRWSINPMKTYKNMTDGTFWENVKPSKFTPESRPKWMNFNDQWVDELRRGFAACAVFVVYPIYWLTYNQLNNNLVSQANVMQLHGIPNDVLSNLDPFALLIFIPLCDFFFYPLLRRFKINFSPIKKIAFGFYTGAAAMVWAAVVQYYIYQKSECGYYASGTLADGETACANVDINVWAQTGSYVLIALSEIFASITSLEYAFSKAPKNMRSMVQAVALFTSAFSAALGEAWTPLSTDPYLVWNYGSVAILAGVTGIAFHFIFNGLDKEEDALNELPEGKVYGGNSDDEELHREADKSVPHTATDHSESKVLAG